MKIHTSITKQYIYYYATVAVVYAKLYISQDDASIVEISEGNPVWAGLASFVRVKMPDGQVNNLYIDGHYYIALCCKHSTLVHFLDDHLKSIILFAMLVEYCSWHRCNHYCG